MEEFEKGLDYPRISTAMMDEKMQYPDNLDEEKVMKRWHEAISAGPFTDKLDLRGWKIKGYEGEGT